MKKMNVFQLNLAQLIWRFYLMMAIVIGFGMIHQFNLAAVFGFAIAISAILGVGIERSAERVAQQKPLNNRVKQRKEAA